MTSYEYTYLSIKDIFEKIPYASNNINLAIFSAISIILVFLSVHYIFPIIQFSIEHFKKEYIKKQKKLMLRKILIQKEIEEEMEKSVLHKKES